MRLLVVEDDDRVAAALCGVLTRHGFTVSRVRTGAGALKQLASRPDLVLLDLGLPDRDGFEVCARIRQISDVPIIMVTARTELTARVQGLYLGADDYIVKPYDLRELLARIHAVVRRVGEGAPGHMAGPSSQTDPSGRTGPSRRAAPMSPHTAAPHPAALLDDPSASAWRDAPRQTSLSGPVRRWIDSGAAASSAATAVQGGPAAPAADGPPTSAPRARIADDAALAGSTSDDATSEDRRAFGGRTSSRHLWPSSTVVEIHGVRIDLGRREVTADGRPVTLTRKEFDLLAELAWAPGVVCRREQLVGAVWGSTTALASRTLEVHIASLRGKLGPSSSVVQTVRGVGYRLVAPK